MQRAMEKLRILLCNVISRATVKRVNDAKKMQAMQIAVLSDEMMDDVERFQNYGFSSNPKPDSEAIVIAVGADRSHPVILAVDDRRFRVTGLKSGEVCIYTDEGDKIHFKRGRSIVVETLNCTVNASEKYTVNTGSYTVNADDATINAPDTTLNATTGVLLSTPSMAMSSPSGGAAVMELTGVMNVDGNVTADGVSLNSHTHTGVQSGGGSSGGPQ